MSGRPDDDHARAASHAELARLEHVFVAHDDVSLHVVRSRAEDRGERRTPVLFLHGYPDTADTWSLQMASLGQTHPVAAFDQRGVGRSTAPTGAGSYAFARYLADIEAVIDEVAGPEGQVHLVAHDWGGALAWMFAEEPRYARRLRSLSVLAGPHPGLFQRSLIRAARSPRRLGFLFDQLRRSWYILFFQLPWLPEQVIGRQFPKAWVRALRAGGVPKEDPLLREFDAEGTRKAALTPLALYRQVLIRRPQLRPVEVPTCLMVPTHDFALRPEVYDDISEVAADLEVHRLDANHWAHREQAAEVSAILEAFIRRVEHDA
ncbi:alpha/beta fold hydrolase [Nannocystis bainbridge]|uniref:Alpha/beta fold hydrolase n=1 Tax=Nannocystis bainbridge TaxID=2995303 RepID=A0ABT5E9S6_9BACT|nr:alpha/beta fold hydrolase [Nannocystis bainbridge]MDC0722203.1 alpha/beta fold hydrolase [Nannocystis bainbridge]